MAKKSREEKIYAHQKRLELNQQLNQNNSFYSYPVQLIKKDLTKTLLLSILAVSLELALFLILEKHLILPFKIKF